MTVSPPGSSSSSAGEVTPQYGHTSADLAGFHSASPPQAGQENFCLAVTSAIQEGVESCLGDTPGRANLFALDVPGFQAAQDIGFRHTEGGSHFGHAEELCSCGRR